MKSSNLRRYRLKKFDQNLVTVTFSIVKTLKNVNEVENRPPLPDNVRHSIATEVNKGQKGLNIEYGPCFLPPQSPYCEEGRGRETKSYGEQTLSPEIWLSLLYHNT